MGVVWRPDKTFPFDQKALVCDLLKFDVALEDNPITVVDNGGLSRRDP